jgi:predicted transcriptional regulator
MGKSLAEIVGEIVLAQSGRRDLDADEITRISIETAKAFKVIQQMDKGGNIQGESLFPSTEPTSSPEQSAQHDAEQALALPPPPDNRPKIDPKDSILEDKVICLECGEEFHQISYKHLAQHGLTVDEYKAKYGLPKRQPLVCWAFSRKRSERVKNDGLAQKMKAARAAKKAFAQSSEQHAIAMELEASKKDEANTTEEISKKEETAVSKKEKTASKKEETKS